MAAPITEKNDVKIFILYLLMHIDSPVDFVTLNDIVLQDGYVNQFDFMDCFYELSETDAIEKTVRDGRELYMITGKGRAAADTLQSGIKLSIREKSVRSALDLLSFERRGAKAGSRVESLPGGSCRLVCSVTGRDGEIMKINVTLDTRHQAELMKFNFDDKPEFVYRAVLSILSGDVNYLAESWSDNQ